MGEQGRRYVLANFAPHRIADRILNKLSEAQMMEDSEDFVDVASVAAKIKERVQRRKELEQQSPSALGSLAARLALASGTYAVGDLPPGPPTVRGKAGLLAIRAMQRALFWYTPPIRRFQEDSAKAISDRAQVCAALIRECQNLATAVRGVTSSPVADGPGRVSDGAVSDLRAQVDALQARITELQTQSQIEALRAEVAALASQVQELLPLRDQAHCIMSQLQTLAALPAQFQAQASQLHALEAATAAIPAIAAHLQALQAETDRRAQHLQALDRLAHHTRAANVLQERRLSLVLTEARRQGLVSAAPNLPEEASPIDLYSELTAMFRGGEEEIGERQTAYLPYLDALRSPHSRAVDLGCGRGEWLDLLRQQGISAAGVEANPEFVAKCRERGLEIHAVDALSWLEQCPERTVDLVTAFHLVEHFSSNDLLRFLDGVLRVLRPVGIAIFETPNPANLQVGGRTFWLDPTHQRPLPSELLTFLVEARGFSQLEVVHLHPYPESLRFGSEAGAVGEFLNNQFFGPQDYAVVVRRP